MNRGLLSCVLFLGIVSKCTCETRQTWMENAQKQLQMSLEMKQNTNVAKNVIFFLGDGMGVSTVTAGRILRGQMNGKNGEETILSFERFPHVALSKTYNVDRQTADSAGTATAFLCGVKANYGTIGVDSSVTRKNCSAQEAGKVTSIMKWSQDEGKSLGIVTTARVTHATPAASYAYSADRNWEGDVDLVNVTGGCKDIAQQLVDNLDIQVVLGGGRRTFLLNNMTDPETGKIGSKHRMDGRDLIKDWKADKVGKGKTHEYVWKKSQFDAVDPVNTDYLLGLFGESHMQYESDRDKGPDGEPSLAEMTGKAIQILQKNKKGYFLLVEAGRIDHAHHDNNAKRALTDLLSLDDAVKTAIDMTKEEDTLYVVTADHSHVFNIAGYAKRGNDIFGLSVPYSPDSTPEDKMPYTTLLYVNGPGPGRVNLTGTNTDDVDFLQSNLVNMESETHGGEDVAIYAMGPMSHLLHGVQEQNYIPHVMAYASCVGTNKKHCASVTPTTNPCSQGANSVRGNLALLILLSHGAFINFRLYE